MSASCLSRILLSLLLQLTEDASDIVIAYVLSRILIDAVPSGNVWRMMSTRKNDDNRSLLSYTCWVTTMGNKTSKTGQQKSGNIFDAIQSRDKDLFLRFLKPKYANKKNAHGETPLMVAAWNNEYGACLALLQNGAMKTLDAVAKNGESALSGAEKAGYRHICDLLRRAQQGLQLDTGTHVARLLESVDRPISVLSCEFWQTAKISKSDYIFQANLYESSAAE